MDSNNIGGSVYELIVRQVIEKGVCNVITGDIYITRKRLRQDVLGRRFHIPEHAQVRIVRELVHLELLVEEKTKPDCVLIYNNAEVFYRVPVVVSKRLKSGIQKV